MQSRICETQEMQVDLRCNSDARSDFCTLDFSQMAIVLSSGARLFVIVHTLWNTITTIRARCHISLKNLFLCISSLCFCKIGWFYITSKIQNVFSAIISSTERFSENI